MYIPGSRCVACVRVHTYRICFSCWWRRKGGEGQGVSICVSLLRLGRWLAGTVLGKAVKKRAVYSALFPPQMFPADGSRLRAGWHSLVLTWAGVIPVPLAFGVGFPACGNMGKKSAHVAGWRQCFWEGSFIPWSACVYGN